MVFRTCAMGVLIVLVASFASGCSKLTFERWQTLNTQSSKMEVEAVLGEPNQYKKADRWMYHNPDEQITCTVEFAGGGDSVTYSQWVDPKHGRHEVGKAEIEGSNLIQRDTGKTDIDKPQG